MSVNHPQAIVRCARRNQLFMVSVVMVLLLSGCLMPKSYVDPVYSKVDYSDIKRRSEPYRLEIYTEFLRDGEHYPKGDQMLKSRVERIVRATSFAIPVTENAEGKLSITVNNFGDKGEAVAKGFGTGLTFGLIGSTVTDYYEMKGELRMEDGTLKEGSYQHAIHTTIGNKEGPAGLVPKTPNDAFDDVLEDLILRFIYDIQDSLQQESIQMTPLSIFLRLNVQLQYL